MTRWIAGVVTRVEDVMLYLLASFHKKFEGGEIEPERAPDVDDDDSCARGSLDHVEAFEDDAPRSEREGLVEGV